MSFRKLTQTRPSEFSLRGYMRSFSSTCRLLTSS